MFIIKNCSWYMTERKKSYFAAIEICFIWFVFFCLFLCLVRFTLSLKIIYLRDKVILENGDVGTERDLATFTYCSNGCNGTGHNQEPGNLVRCPSTRAISCCFPRSIIRELHWKGCSWNLTQCSDVECSHYRPTWGFAYLISW